VDTAARSHRRGTGSAHLIYRVAHARGVPTEVLLAGCGGLTEAAIRDPQGLLTTAQELRLIDNVLSAVDDPALGVDIGRRHTPGSYGLLGFGLLSSPTVLSALELSMAFRPLTYVFVEPLMRPEGGHVVATLPPPADVPARTVHFLADLWAATLAAVLRALAPGLLTYRSVTLPRPAPTDDTPWVAALGTRPRFGAAVTAVEMDRDTLAHRLPTADPQALAYCERRCADLLRRHTARVDTASAVREQLLGHSGHIPSQHEVAWALGLSERTLHRRLTAEATSFRRLCDQVRLTLAEDMLARPELSLAQIASTLGYDHPASFTRAYRRWTGRRPSDARPARFAPAHS
jgi:AraC-like DNA-binding protein